MVIRFSPRMLKGTINAMPSKSHAHRILIACKLAEIQGNAAPGQADMALFSDDVEATARCLVQLDKAAPFLECGESGSTLRFLLPVVMALKNNATFLGTGRLPDRPISPLKEEMADHGCFFRMGSSRNADRFKEICTVSGRLQPGEYSLPGNISSQFITGLLFALPLLNGNSILSLTTDLESAGYVEMTLDVLSHFGIKIETCTSEEGFPVYSIPGNQIYVRPDNLTIDGDWSNSAFWLAAGALSGDITVRGLSLDSCQWDKEILNILVQMGADLDITGRSDGLVDIRSKAGNIKGVEADVSQVPDLTPVLSVLMTFAEGTSMICHGERLRYKESNRLKTIYSMLCSLGADISYGGDRLSFTGAAYLKGGVADSYNDHRVAMAAAIVSCLCSGDIFLQNPSAVTKSYPGFYKDFEALGGELEYL